MLCLGYVNIGRDILQIQELLLSSHLLEDLPWLFSAKLSHAICYEKHSREQFLSILADALQEAGDPLVVICSQESYSQFSNLKACVISSERLKCRESAIAILFAKAVCQHRESLVSSQEKLQIGMPCSTKPSSPINSKRKDATDIPFSAPAEPQNLIFQSRNDDKDNENKYNDLSMKCNGTK